MTHSVSQDRVSTPGKFDGSRDEPGADVGPDPVFGAGIALLGILVMGISGASDAHYAFDVGVLTAVLGAGTFVVSVALSAMKQKKLAAENDERAPRGDA
ncbi:MAG TPA: hypothetical protein VHB21_12315 [Minicystis sp.]|nr:hypothetical protein [Minicystis sp.]